MKAAMQALGTPHQLGYVFADMDDAITTFSSMYAFEETRRFAFEAEQHWVRGKHFPIKLDIFHGVINGTEYELITPLSDGPHKWFLDEFGGGLQHIGYNVDDYDHYADILKSAGMTVLMNVDCDVYESGATEPDHSLIAAYFEKPSMGNLLIEIAARRHPQRLTLDDLFQTTLRKD